METKAIEEILDFVKEWQPEIDLDYPNPPGLNKIIEAGNQLAALKAENARLQEYGDEWQRACQEAVRIGESQALDWDRFWEAMGVKSKDISVDQAIDKYKAVQTDLAALRKVVEAAQEWKNSFFEKNTPVGWHDNKMSKLYDAIDEYQKGQQK